MCKKGHFDTCTQNSKNLPSVGGGGYPLPHPRFAPLPLKNPGYTSALNILKLQSHDSGLNHFVQNLCGIFHGRVIE